MGGRDRVCKLPGSWKWGISTFHPALCRCAHSGHGVGSSLAVQWLGLGAVTVRARVQPLVGELRSHKPHSTAKKKQKKATVSVFPWSIKTWGWEGPSSGSLTSLWSGPAGRWSAVVGAPPSPELLGHIGLGPGSPRRHVCPDGMSGEPQPLGDRTGLSVHLSTKRVTLESLECGEQPRGEVTALSPSEEDPPSVHVRPTHRELWAQRPLLGSLSDAGTGHAAHPEGQVGRQGTPCLQPGARSHGGPVVPASGAAPLSRSPAVWLDLVSQQQLAWFPSWGAAC